MRYIKTILPTILLFSSVIVFGISMLLRQDFAVQYLGSLLDEYSFRSLPYNIMVDLQNQSIYVFYSGIGLLCFAGILVGVILFISSLLDKAN
jgi:hypothetical protein